MKIKTGDTVAVIAGRDQFVVDKKGNKTRKTGRVIKVLKKENKVIVEGVNIVTKHEAPSQMNEKGGKIQVEAPIHVSNVALINPKTNTPTRISIQVDKDGKKIRTSTKKTGYVSLEK